MKIAIDSDKNGEELKRTLFQFLTTLKVDVTDLEYFTSHPQDDYPDVALNLAQKVAQKAFERGILICGTGLGMAMIANKVPGVFAGACSDVYSAERLVKSNDAQILCLGALVIGPELAKSIVNAWIHSDFQAGRSLPKRMREIDKENFHQFNNK